MASGELATKRYAYLEGEPFVESMLDRIDVTSITSGETWDAQLKKVLEGAYYYPIRPGKEWSQKLATYFKAFTHESESEASAEQIAHQISDRIDRSVFPDDPRPSAQLSRLLLKGITYDELKRKPTLTLEELTKDLNLDIRRLVYDKEQTRKSRLQRGKEHPQLEQGVVFLAHLINNHFEIHRSTAPQGLLRRVADRVTAAFNN